MDFIKGYIFGCVVGVFAIWVFLKIKHNYDNR
jgi:hypothetical protein